MTSDALKTGRVSFDLADDPRRRRVAIHTHGCKLNQADSQVLARQFSEAGYEVVDESAAADIIVLNSCTVTATADAKARQSLRAARRRNPGAVVVATGCYAQRAPADLEDMAEVSLVVGNTAKPTLVEAAQRVLEGATPPAKALPMSRPRGAGRTRAMVKIQEGCNQVCAYCIVPRVRGRERSITPEDIVEEVNRNAADGFREVVLTGTQLGTYGFDLADADLQALLARILAETMVERIRVSSLQAHEITPALLVNWSNPRLMQHFHIPLQSGCDTTLKAMRRRYDTARFARSVELVRDMYPSAGITTDIIVGFPGETPEDFERSVSFAGRMGFSDIHVFPYSQRPGTSAVYLSGQVNEPEKRHRMEEMLSLSSEAKRRFRESQFGSIRPVLWEHKPEGHPGPWSGLTDNYIRVRADSTSDLGNTIRMARLNEIEGDFVRSEELGEEA